ncbi:rRNA methylase [Rheinheimera sp. A13L]|uniref:RNA methyltransferase substrate-binding domain-containing protein n=1 Tax=Rheinheimera sp. A13L TaxID=506534 RepID=UPI0002124C4D|nr:RNA methyltransferase substrate-binding domain-containing protein [Rheinheimera sp. A13L]EGM76396.1 rRNA methylase [Rheinheimera sp. A13L]
MNRKTSAPQHKKAQPGSELQKPWTKTKAAAAKKPETKAAQPKTVSAKVLKQNRQEEAKIYGENACRVAFLQRPDALVRLYLSEQMAPKFADLMKYLAANKKAYHVVSEAELEKVAGSQHHGGVVLLVKRKPVLSLATYLTQNGRKKQDCLLALDGVGNPHKIGSTNSAFF